LPRHCFLFFLLSSILHSPFAVFNPFLSSLSLPCTFFLFLF
jgi:hypothetical protein